MDDYRCHVCHAMMSRHTPDTSQAAGSREWRGCPPDRWTVAEGRCIAFDGAPLFTVDGLTDARGYRYIPAELDALTREIAAALNAAGVDGSRVARG